MRNRISGIENRFNRSYHYGAMVEKKKNTERKEGPRAIAIKMYNEGKTLNHILCTLKIFDEEIIIGWFLEEFPREEVMKYYIKYQREKLMQEKLQKRLKEEGEGR